MTRASKRKSDHQSSAPVKNARVDSVRSASSKAATKAQERVDELYNKYANKLAGLIETFWNGDLPILINDHHIIIEGIQKDMGLGCQSFWEAKTNPEGIEALCSDLQVDYTDVRILMLAWKMNAQKQGYFTQDEWRKGLKALRVDSINKLKKSLPELEKEVLKLDNFEDFYKYAFRYCLTEEKQKCLDIESACMLIDLVLGSKYQPQVDAFTKFLKIQSDYKVMNLDQWTNLLRFCQEISFPDLKNYDTCEAWPLLLDNFVDWMNQKPDVTSK